jgi:hypothetical protein
MRPLLALVAGLIFGIGLIEAAMLAGMAMFELMSPSSRRGSGFTGPPACLAGRMAARRGHPPDRPSRRRSAWSRGPRSP